MDLPFGFGRYVDEYWEPYAGVSIPPFAGQPHPPQHGHQFQRHPAQGLPHHIDPSQGHHRYQYWPQQWMDACGRGSQRPVLVHAGDGQQPKATEPKPRLSKEEVDSLEKEFAKNAKPNSSTKRELAERLSVEVPRINNWFQNRRAKEKQIKKTREFEAQQERERATSESKTSEDGESGVVSEFYGLANYHQPAGLSSAIIGEDDEEEEEDDEEGSHVSKSQGEDEQEEEDEDEDEEADEEEFAHHTEGQQQATDGIKAETGVETIPHYHQSHSAGDSDIDNMGLAGYAPLPTENQNTPSIGADVASNNFHATQVQNDFQIASEHPYTLGDQSRATGLASSAMDNLVTPQPHLMSDAIMFDDLQASEYFGNSSMHSFLPGGIHDTLVDEPIASIETSQHCEVLEDDIKLEHLSPSSMSHSPHPPADQRFKSPPPPTDIAARRNIRRPPSLGLGSLRGFSHSQGPKTCIDVSRRPDAPTPMRRMTSAGLGLSGRIQKAGLVPRSPFSLDRNRAALLHTLQGTSAPGLASLNCALSPLSPNGLNLGENQTPTNISDEEHKFRLGSFGGHNMEQPMRTPPATPGLPSNFQEPMFYFHLDQHWNAAPQDEPLQTPSLGSHGGSEFEFSGYVVSQPATPSLPMHIGPAHGLHGKVPSNVEYTFPDSFPGYSAKSSPGQPKSQQFQFAQNVTPQDFNMDR